MKLNSVYIMEKAIYYSEKVHVCNKRKFDTDYKDMFDNYVYYVICRSFTTLGRLTSSTSRFVDNLFCVYSWVEPFPDPLAFVRTAYIWQTNLWNINNINLLFLEITDDSTSVDSHSAVYHPLSELRRYSYLIKMSALCARNDSHNTPSVYCVRMYCLLHFTVL
jgi:hypothetical protein